MENKKLISSFEFSVYNCLVEIISEILYLYLIYFVYQKSKEIFAYTIRLGKSFNTSSQNRSCAIRLRNYILGFTTYSLSILTFYLMLIYFFNLSSLINLRKNLFTYWKHLFKSDSNLTDLNSFLDYYCDSAHPPPVGEQTSKYLSESINNLCGWSIVDTMSIEQTLMQIIFITNFILVIINDGNVQSNDNNSTSRNRFNYRLTCYLRIISFVLDQLIKIYLYFQCIYFVIVLLSMLNNYGNMKALHTGYNTSTYNGISSDNLLVNHTNENLNTLMNNIQEEKLEIEPDKPSQYSKVFSAVIDIIIEIIGLYA